MNRCVIDGSGKSSTLCSIVIKQLESQSMHGPSGTAVSRPHDAVYGSEQLRLRVGRAANPMLVVMKLV